MSEGHEKHVACWTGKNVSGGGGGVLDVVLG